MLYLVDARAVLHPRTDEVFEIDWSGVGMFDDDRDRLSSMINIVQQSTESESASVMKLDSTEIAIVSETCSSSSGWDEVRRR